jgi:hypothetical protein
MPRYDRGIDSEIKKCEGKKLLDYEAMIFQAGESEAAFSRTEQFNKYDFRNNQCNFYENEYSLYKKRRRKIMNAINEREIENIVDENGNPTGGGVTGTGLLIDWQNGPLGRGAQRQEPNGAFVETVISAAKQRLEFYQMAHGGKFSCAENEDAITHLEAALTRLDERTKNRETREVEGTHIV